MAAGPFERVLTVLVGVAAVLASLLATLQLDANNKSNRDSLLSARLPVQIFEQIAASGIYTDFHVNASRQANAVALEALSRQIVGLRAGQAGLLQSALGQSELSASKALAAAAAEMAQIDPKSRGVDPATARAILATTKDFQKEVTRQGKLVDDSNRYSTQGSRAIFGLSLAAIAAALLGLAAVLRVGAGGKIALAAGAVALAASAGWGTWALVG